MLGIIWCWKSVKSIKVVYAPNSSKKLFIQQIFIKTYYLLDRDCTNTKLLEGKLHTRYPSRKLLVLCAISQVQTNHERENPRAKGRGLELQLRWLKKQSWKWYHMRYSWKEGWGKIPGRKDNTQQRWRQNCSMDLGSWSVKSTSEM